MFKYFRELASPHGQGDDILDFWKTANLHILPFPSFPSHFGNLPLLLLVMVTNRKFSVEATILGLL